jgi:phosphohistidine phosphatase
MKKPLAIIMRHAKAEEGRFGMSDRERKLTKTGHEEATEAGQRIHAAVGVVDRIVSSEYVRAQETAKDVHTSLSEIEKDVALEVDARLNCESSVDSMLELIAEQGQETVIYVLHMPQVQELCWRLIAGSSVDLAFTTCAWAVISLDAPGRLRGELERFINRH